MIGGVPPCLSLCEQAVEQSGLCPLDDLHLDAKLLLKDGHYWPPFRLGPSEDNCLTLLLCFRYRLIPLYLPRLRLSAVGQARRLAAPLSWRGTRSRSASICGKAG